MILNVKEHKGIRIIKPEYILKDEFKDLLKHSEQVAKKLWGNKTDDVWDKV